MKTETIEMLAGAGNKTTGGGALVGFLGWLASSNAIGAIGLAVAVIGMLVNWYYKREANRRLGAEHLLRQQERQMRMDLMRATGQPHTACDTPTDLGALEAME